MMTRPIPTPIPNPKTLPFRRPALLVLLSCSLAGFLAPAAADTQTFEVLRPGFFQAGNQWEFSSSTGDTAFITTWDIVAVPGSTSTVILRETARPGSPYYVDDLTVTLDSVAMQMSKLYETQYNPTVHIEVTYTPAPGLPKIPRVVNKADNNRLLGRADSAGKVIENPTQTWTSHQDQFVTYLTTQTIGVPAGSFSDCVTFRVTENWRYNDGWTGIAFRDFAISQRVGPVKMSYQIWDFRPDGSLYRNAIIVHSLRAFRPAVPDLVPSAGNFNPIAALAGTTVTVNWQENSFYKASLAHVSDIFLSTDTVITANDIRLVRKSVPAIGAGSGIVLTAAGAVPGGTRTGAYTVAIVADSLNQNPDYDRPNNTYLIPGKLNVVARPDLAPAVNSFSPSTMKPGEVLSMSGAIRNIGGLNATPTFARVYLSTDTVINSNDFLLISGIPVPTVTPGSQFAFLRDAFVPSPFPDGVYHVGILADATNAIAEANENNNTTASAGMVIIGFPDLAVTGGTFTPLTRQPGQTITITATVQNTGVFTAGANSIGIYLSADNHITTGDTQLGPLLSSPALSSGSVITINAVRAIPVTTIPRTYYVGVFADVTNVVIESDEANNGRALAGTLVVTPPPLPDLVPSLGSFSPPTIVAGTNVTVNWRETSLYRNSAAHSTDVYLSTDTVITSRDIRLTRKSVPAINASTSVTLSAVAAVPAQVAGGQYYIVVVVDALNQVAEWNEQNNTYVFPGRLAVLRTPDLTPIVNSFSPSGVRPGRLLTVSGTILNIGGLPAPASLARVYLSTDTVINTRDTLLMNNIPIPVIAGQGQYPFTRTATVPSPFPNGSYHVGIICDATDAVVEGDENNNAVASPGVVVIGYPDLQVTGGSTFLPHGVRPGQMITVEANVQNAGVFTAEPTSLGIYLSTDNLITTGDTQLGLLSNCPALTSNSAITLNLTPVIPTTTAVGTYYIGVICDVGHKVVESNESNNARALTGTLLVTTATADLRVEGLDFSPWQLWRGDPIHFSGSIVNDGLATTQSFYVGFYISRQSDFSWPRMSLCAAVSVPPMAGNGDRFPLNTLARTVLSSVTSGTYTVGIIIDGQNRIPESNKANNTAWVHHKRLYLTPVRNLDARHWELYR